MSNEEMVHMIVIGTDTHKKSHTAADIHGLAPNNLLGTYHDERLAGSRGMMQTQLKRH